MDEYSNPVEGAIVYGEWSGNATTTDEFATDENGWGTSYSDWRLDDDEFTFCVINVTKDNWVYDSDANVVTCGNTSSSTETMTCRNIDFDQVEQQVGRKFAWSNPNPFNPTTTISYFVPEVTHVKVEINNILDKRIMTLLDSRVEAGVSSVVWNAKDENGIDMSSGTYFYRITFDNFYKNNYSDLFV